jgi:uncharacterized metal-binding protein
MDTLKMGIIVCKDSLSELVAREALKEFNSDIALYPLSSDAMDVKKNARYVLVVDACSDECGKKRAETLGIYYDEYLNLEKELGIKMPCSKKPSVDVVDDVGLAAARLVERIKEVLVKV